VLGGVRASSSLGVLSRLLSEPAHEAELLRFELSYALRLLLHQRLLPRARVAGRTAAFEQLINTSQVAQLIRDDKLQQLPAVLAAGKTAGMMTLDDALDELVRSAAITPEAARAVARKSERFSARSG
jgi:twitching motility protein PilT